MKNAIDLEMKDEKTASTTRLKTVTYLCEQRADITAKCNKGWLAFHYGNKQD